jgi:hypothetical protein
MNRLKTISLIISIIVQINICNEHKSGQPNIYNYITLSAKPQQTPMRVGIQFSNNIYNSYPTVTSAQSVTKSSKPEEQFASPIPMQMMFSPTQKEEKITQFKQQFEEYQHKDEWQNHQDIVISRNNALKELEIDDQQYTTEYTLSEQTKAYLDAHHINNNLFTICSGNILQHTIHMEFIAINEKAAFYWHQKTFLKSNKKVMHSIAHLTDAGIAFNSIENISKAIIIANTCWVLIDCIQAFGEGLIEGTYNTINNIIHPISTIKNISNSTAICGYYIGKTIIEIGKLGYIAFISPETAYNKISNWTHNFSMICTGLKEKYQILKIRDIVKTTTILSLECYAIAKISYSFHCLFDSAKKYAHLISKQINTISNNKEILATPEGIIISIADNAIEYIKHNQTEKYTISQIATVCNKLTTREAIKIAEQLKFKKTNYYSHGQPIFKKGGIYITPDIDTHSGGVWKMASSIENLRNKKTRMGTYDAYLNRIGD